MAKALDLVSQITTISLISVLPAVGGYFIDNWLGTKIAFMLIGLGLGMTAAGFQLKTLVKKLDPGSVKSKK
jgi:F0F1-type ATP synthase assembly protein I